MGATVVEKIARAHMTYAPQRALRPGDIVALRPRHVLTHDNTAAVLGKFRSIGAERVADPSQPVFALDHDIQNRSPENLAKYERIRAFAAEQGVDFHPAGTGIGHQIVLDHGYAVPGALVVASDSHANTYGAVGALGTPVVRTDAAALWATGEFWWQIPRTLQVLLTGTLRPGVSGKDVILALCGLFPSEALNAAVEFAGPGVASLDMAARMTIANMTTEWGSLTGWFPVDDVTLEYLEGRRAALASLGAPERIAADDLARWRHDPPAPDPDASYAARITLDLSAVTPRLAGPDTVQAVRALAEAAGEEIPVDRAYLLSCVAGRLEDLEAAASVLRGRRVADGVRLYVAAASAEIQAEAERSGAWETLAGAGATTLPPGCGPCIGLGEGLLEAGEVGISATNRNFKGRMGSRDARVYLASPAAVAASAAAGRIVAPPSSGNGGNGGNGEAPELRADFERFPSPAPPSERAEILDGFPATLTGRLVFVPRDNLNTDGIYGKDHTYRELSPEEMAEVVMANHDPAFAGRTAAGDVLVGGYNFGTGSSREQAATALQAKGIALVVAASFSQTYLRNAYNNGFVCVECPALVDRLREAFADEVAAAVPTLVPGDELEVDFAAGTLAWRGESFAFPPLGRVAQGLVVAGGLEAQVRARLERSRVPSENPS